MKGTTISAGTYQVKGIVRQAEPKRVRLEPGAGYEEQNGEAVDDDDAGDNHLAEAYWLYSINGPQANADRKEHNTGPCESLPIAQTRLERPPCIDCKRWSRTVEATPGCSSASG